MTAQLAKGLLWPIVGDMFDAGYSFAHIAASVRRSEGRVRQIVAALRVASGTISPRLRGLHHVEVARRCADLHATERAEPTDETRGSPSGRQCRVWRLA
ncbi:MAG: hypothetical protein ACRENK_15715 [Gemmatimonadaceae bacterium]